MNTISKKYIGYTLGAFIALSLMLPAVLGLAHPASAAAADTAPLTGDQLFGGGTSTGATFAGTAGLQGGNLIDMISSVVRLAIGFLGVIAVIIILLGGFKWMTSGGAEDKVKKAKALIFQGIIGLVIVLSAYAIATFVINSVITAQGSTNVIAG